MRSPLSVRYSALLLSTLFFKNCTFQCHAAEQAFTGLSTELSINLHLWSNKLLNKNTGWHLKNIPHLFLRVLGQFVFTPTFVLVWTNLLLDKIRLFIVHAKIIHGNINLSVNWSRDRWAVVWSSTNWFTSMSFFAQSQTNMKQLHKIKSSLIWKQITLRCIYHQPPLSVYIKTCIAVKCAALPLQRGCK